MVNVACFLTCGWTEAGEMQQFLSRIRKDCTFHQCFPNKTRKRKAKDRFLVPEYSGLTGKPLLERVLEVIGTHPEYRDNYDAVLIEDDLDLRFRNMSDDEIEEIINEQNNQYRRDWGRRYR